MRLSMTLQIATALCLASGCTMAFVPLANRHQQRILQPIRSSSTATDDDQEIQWDLFQKHHAKDPSMSSWKGIWTTYDYIGDVMDETVASVDYTTTSEGTVQQSHTIVVGATRSDCSTCFDSMQTKKFPVAMYGPGVMNKARLGSVGMVNGPSLLRSGAMATELVLSHGDGRVRVTFQHGPVWPQGVEPNTGPPVGMKLFRTTVSREALRDAPPTAETEAANPPSDGNPVFYRGVPPFAWHKVWGGTSWTWGPQSGNQGWAITQVEEADAWHGRATGDSPNCWNLRLPGGILIHGPRVVEAGGSAICRLAWMPNEDTLLRIDSSITALEPMMAPDDDDMMVGFLPPSLVAYRCDVLKNQGQLDNPSTFVREGEEDTLTPKSDADIAKESSPPTKQMQNEKASGETSSDKDSGLDAIRAALQL